MSLEKIINDKYKQYGILKANGEIILPLNTQTEFINDCNRLLVAVVGLDFFVPQGEGAFMAGLNSLDTSAFLRSYQTWEEVVLYCNREANIVLQKEIEREAKQYYCPVLFEKSEWEQGFRD